MHLPVYGSCIPVHDGVRFLLSEDDDLLFFFNDNPDADDLRTDFDGDFFLCCCNSNNKGFMDNFLDNCFDLDLDFDFGFDMTSGSSVNNVVDGPPK